MVLGLSATPQLVFDGVVNGAVIGLLAIGIVLVNRSTRVINFAVASMGLVGAGLLALLCVQYDTPFWLAAGAALLVGTAYGAAIELTVVRRLFRAPRVILLVATVGVAQLSQAITLAYPQLDDLSAPYPVPIGGEWADVLGLRVRGPQVAILVAVPLVAGALAWFLNRTVVGQTVKASAENAELARLCSISPKLASTMVWSIAGFLASLSMVLLGGLAGTANTVSGLGPPTLARALAAAVIAGMASFPRALLAGVAIGVLEALFRFNFLDVPSLVDALVFVLVAVAVWFQSRRSPETATFSYAPRARPLPAQLRDRWWARNVGALGLVALAAAGVALPFVVTQPSRIVLYATILTFALCALSVSVLTGWTGQLSLGQMAFAGLGP